MAQAPYLPSGDLPIAVWMLNFTTLLTAAPLTYGETAGTALTCANAYAAYQAALNLVQDPSTKTAVTVAGKNYQRSLALAAITPVATRISANPSVTPENKTAIGVTVRLSTRTRSSVNELPCTLTLEELTPQNVTLRTQNPDTPNTTARPYGARVAEIQFRVRNAGDTANEFTVTTSATRRFVTIPTEEEWRGRRVFYKARWVGAALNGGAPNIGAWSEELELLLP